MPPAAGPGRDRLRGALDLLILRTLAWGPLHGYAIARWLASSSADVIRIEEGSLYPALHRLERNGLVAADWQMTDLGRPAKVYEITDAGRTYLREEGVAWLDFVRVVSRLLEPAV